MYQSAGQIKCSLDNKKLIVVVDPGIVDYYRWFVPHSVQLNKTRYEPHITVARNEILTGSCQKYSQLTVEFEYDTDIRYNDVYWWLPVYSDDLTNIRINLGLAPSSQWSRPPDDSDCFHITIGNLK